MKSLKAVLNSVPTGGHMIYTDDDGVTHSMCGKKPGREWNFPDWMIWPCCGNCAKAVVADYNTAMDQRNAALDDVQTTASCIADMLTMVVRGDDTTDIVARSREAARNLKLKSPTMAQFVRENSNG